jgi:ankyrin repeat protein
LNGDLAVVQAELDKGVDVNAKNNEGKTPRDWAIGFASYNKGVTKHTETADFLRKHGGKTGTELKTEGK